MAETGDSSPPRWQQRAAMMMSSAMVVTGATVSATAETERLGWDRPRDPPLTTDIPRWVEKAEATTAHPHDGRDGTVTGDHAATAPCEKKGHLRQAAMMRRRRLR
ncbi:hypothetical protein GUJ93_ZPchr0008g13410 [Zizania palustris]|uniref:Uncharacterized protein n=1 Tax=Zizania palustris TaxID=103762 RepID=A0A8J5RHI9_ZIZPA|nr:hypothetical protein GUJ93_ZPchr0008g13410 [Zizania palustris]